MSDSRIYPNIDGLGHLSQLGKTLAWHPPYQRLTPLTGKHRSHQRGRGLDFVELRHYYPGDDVRCIDWKVTQRTGQPYLRVYAEENDKQIALLIDLRNTMFFASDGSMKSAIASEVAAIISGGIIRDGDRLGAVVLTAQGIITIPCRRGEKALLSILNTLVQEAGKLPSLKPKSVSLADGLETLNNLGLRNSQCFIISDFHDYASSHASRYLDALAKHNSLIGFSINDPLEEKLPTHDVLFGNQELQVEVKKHQLTDKAQFEEHVAEEKQQLKAHCDKHRLPLLNFTTHQETWAQMQSRCKRGNQ
ncbi:DUF58 domain-containing protein [Vibrio astriarenae]|uniref:DUF58 domain-containing protein n=1 Tax=Vibrio astriarenae TaxID=1481923 RepID=A0A7Z2YGD9_9VIBR|nr:DUF58 domain-containing protein [Vibrio astriarenae]QIA66124.1 DUF58 domain-containing protein [Vibrio astriarenae]